MDPNSLIYRYLLDDISEDEARELDRMLAEDPELQREFVIAAATDASLREVAFERAVEPAERTTRPASKTKYLWAAFIAIAAAVLLMFTFRSSEPHTVATLTSSEDAAWESSLPTTPGSKLGPGVLSLKTGIATVRFDSGAEVVLEAPARLELVSRMRGKLVSGAAVIDVPDQAIGFVIETPDGYAVDYGTRFAVRVREQEKQSDFEIIEGEIAVHHPTSGDEVRLTGEGKIAKVTAKALVVAETDSEEVTPAPNLVRIGTSRSGSALKNDKRKKFIDPEVLSVKRTKFGNWDHRSFFAFDLSSVDLEHVDTARLRLNLVPSTRGFVSRLPKINRFAVYGVTDQAKENWEAESLWVDSPGPEDGVLLGEFEIPRSRKRGIFGIQNDSLLEFLRANRDRAVTFVLVRETGHIAGSGPGFTHMFASDAHPESVGPMLEFSLTQ